MRSIRNTRKGLELATYTWEKKSTGEVIVLAGAIHIAHESFWTTYRETIHSYDAAGFDIQLEGLKKIPKGTQVSERTGELIRAFDSLNAMRDSWMVLTGLTSQHTLHEEYKKYGTQDISMTEMIRLMTDEEKNQLIKMSEENPIEIHVHEGNPEEAAALNRMTGRILLFILRHMSLIRLFSKKSGASSGLSDLVVLDARNQYAIDYAKSSPNLHRFLFWGAAHLKGMSKMLKEDGYQRTKVGWTVAIPRTHKVPTL